MKTNDEIIKEVRTVGSGGFFEQNKYLVGEEFRINKALEIQKKEIYEMIRCSDVDHLGHCGCMKEIDKLFALEKEGEQNG